MPDGGRMDPAMAMATPSDSSKFSMILIGRRVPVVSADTNQLHHTKTSQGSLV
jgi:hypothetical protein